MEKVIIYEPKQDIHANLWDILIYIEKPQNYIWKIIELEGVSPGMDQTEILQKIYSNKGYTIDFYELISLVKKFSQIIEITVIGYGEEKDVDLNNYNILHTKVDFFINLIDAWLWEISSKDKLFLDKIKRQFPHKIEYD